jgi:acyl-CoA thioesterase-1
MWIYFLRGWIAVALLFGAQAQATQTILVLGDSLSAAYGLAQDRGWVSLMQQRLQTERYPHHLINASISGETTSGGLYRIDALLASYKPKVVILELGANDGLRGLSLDATQNNLGALIRRAQQSGAQVLLIGMRLPPNYGPAYTEKFQHLFENAAAKYHVRRVPFLLAPIASKRVYFQADGLHPTAEAQPLLLDTVWIALKPMLR